MQTRSRSTRVQRVEHELFEALTTFLLQDLKAELPCHVSITAVEVTPDLRHAKVFFRLAGAESETSAAEQTLSQERGSFQKCVAQSLRMKFCPKLKFEFGTRAERDPVDVLFEQLRKPKNFGFGENL